MEIKIVSCTTKNKTNFRESLLYESIRRLKKLGQLDEEHIFYKNENGLPDYYNEVIENTDLGYLIFVHDDVCILDLFFKNKLLEGFEHFDVLGIAGSADFNINRKPIAWHNSIKQRWSGSVQHPIKDGYPMFGTKEQKYWSYFGPTPKQCVVVDGLFIAANVQKLKEKNVKFDPQFKFDFYDADFCLSSVKAGLKIGVIDVSVFHSSHGKGLLTEEYQKRSNLFYTKWKQ